MATARDVARRAGVSTSTVSHITNGTRLVSDELRGRVLQAMSDLGYEPNAVARSLKIRRSHTIALVIPDIGNPFFTAAVRGVEDVARAHGYTLILGNSDENTAQEEVYLRLLAARRVDGLILAPAGGDSRYLDRVVGEGRPLVLIDRIVPNLQVPAVLVENVEASRFAVNHLIRLGHRRIAMVAGRPGITTTTDRVAGYRAALQEAGIAFDPRLVVSGNARAEGARAATHELLALSPRPTAIFVGNNLMTIGTLEAIDAAGLEIPGDIALVGFDDVPWAEAFRPRLTAVAQPTYEVGHTAAELLISRIETPGEVQLEPVTLPCHLVVRESCGAAATARPGPAST